ncbi:MAG: hypothetical protein IJA61_00825 [Clostridia bacterium]|nr:hypothetical protein [Clostridia bacterium]
MLDKIKMRKIRYDVLSYINSIQLIDKVTNFVDNVDVYKDDVVFVNDLLRATNLDYEADINVIVEKLKQYVVDFEDINNIEHSIILDYIEKVNEVSETEDEEKIEEMTENIGNFIFQLVQIQFLQKNLLLSTSNVYYLGDDGNIYDRESDKMVIKKSEIVKEDIDHNSDVFQQKVLYYFTNIIVENSKKLITMLDFDDDGYYITLDGDDLFSESEKSEILDEHSKRVCLMTGYDDVIREQYKAYLKENGLVYWFNKSDTIDTVTNDGISELEENKESKMSENSGEK